MPRILCIVLAISALLIVGCSPTYVKVLEIKTIERGVHDGEAVHFDPPRYLLKVKNTDNWHEYWIDVPHAVGYNVSVDDIIQIK